MVTAMLLIAADAAISCGQVSSALSPCISYARGKASNRLRPAAAASGAWPAQRGAPLTSKRRAGASRELRVLLFLTRSPLSTPPLSRFISRETCRRCLQRERHDSAGSAGSTVWGDEHDGETTGVGRVAGEGGKQEVPLSWELDLEDVADDGFGGFAAGGGNDAVCCRTTITSATAHCGGTTCLPCMAPPTTVAWRPGQPTTTAAPP
ncbi:hypothetical protein ZWY2020_031729 [Hordeum vulgare]|nr:hypothetical protein ZWY2020_031729 [Hordeum vulgare]